jgi:hypothetical protein
MKNVVTCGCGMRTTAPFMVDGRLLCTVCAEELYPRLVSQRAREEWGKLTILERRNIARAERKHRSAFLGEG